MRFIVMTLEFCAPWHTHTHTHPDMRWVNASVGYAASIVGVAQLDSGGVDYQMMHRDMHITNYTLIF